MVKLTSFDHCFSLLLSGLGRASLIREAQKGRFTTAAMLVLLVCQLVQLMDQRTELLEEFMGFRCKAAGIPAQIKHSRAFHHSCGGSLGIAQKLHDGRPPTTSGVPLSLAKVSEKKSMQHSSQQQWVWTGTVLLKLSSQICKLCMSLSVSLFLNLQWYL